MEMCCPQCETKITWYFGNRLGSRQTFICFSCGRQFSDEEGKW